MQRLTLAQRTKIEKLAKVSSLNRISASLSLPKSTVQYWYSKNSRYRPPKKIKINFESDERIGEFIGVFAGDGNYTRDNSYKHQIKIFITGTDLGYTIYLKELITVLLGKEPWIYIDIKDNVAILRIISRGGIDFIRNYLTWEHTKTKTVRLNSKFKRNSDFLIGFLRGMMDSDGHIDKQSRTAVFSTISMALAHDI